MEFGLSGCNCLKLSRRKMLIGIVMHLVLLFGYSLAAETHLSEADCRPRETVVAISDSHEHRPYHVILHRCEGSCTPQSPLVRTCRKKRFESIDVAVWDHLNRKSIKTMENHTECECACKHGPSACDWSQDGQSWQAQRCACAVNKGHPKFQTSVNNNGNNNTPMPYIYGLIVMGVIVIVLVIGAVLCARRGNGVLYCATRSCHRSNNYSEGSDNREEHQPAATANGQTMNGTAPCIRASRTSIV